MSISAEKQNPQAPEQAQEDPRPGEGAKANGSLAHERGSDVLAIPPIDHIPSFIPEDSPLKLDTPLSLSKLSTSVSTNQYRLPSVKNAGRDSEGRVIPHKRSESIAQIVAELAGLGASENEICVRLNLRPGQLKEHYYNEFTHGAEFADREVAAAAFRMATSEKDTTMTKFWLQSRAKWRTGDVGDSDSPVLNFHIHT